MPYINPFLREKIDNNEFKPVIPGTFAYQITKIINQYLEENGHSYSSYSAIIGVLESVKLELYRRLVAPYEDKKKEENGDVFNTQSYPEKQISTAGINIEKLKDIYRGLNLAYDKLEYLGGSFQPFYDGMIKLAEFIKELERGEGAIEKGSKENEKFNNK